MSDNNFRILLMGILPEFSQRTDQVQERFSQLFRLSPDKTAKLFARNNEVTLKSGLDKQTAQRYINRLNAIGVEARIDPPLALTSSEFSLTEIASTDDSSLEEPPAVEHNFRSERSISQQNTEPAPDHETPAEKPANTESDEPQSMPFVFTGNGTEYFRIWIVNLFLSIITLGIYSAWAKVRRKKYFYGNTLLDDTGFEYDADPKKILFGRAISAVLLAIYLGAEYISTVASLIVFLLLMLALPWIIAKSLQFNARYSSYRHLSFAFKGTIVDAAKAFLLWPLAGFLSFGLLMPFAIYHQQKFMIEGHAYGTSEFDFSANASDYYRLVLTLAGGLILAIVAIILLSFLGLSLLVAPLILITYLLMFTGFTVMMANIRYNYTALANHSFHAEWQLGSYTRLFFVNSLMTVITLGLFIPWAKVRTANYKAEHTWFLANGDIDAFIADQQEQIDALGEGVSDLFDIELGL